MRFLYDFVSGTPLRHRVHSEECLQGTDHLQDLLGKVSNPFAVANDFDLRTSAPVRNQLEGPILAVRLEDGIVELHPEYAFDTCKYVKVVLLRG